MMDRQNSYLEIKEEVEKKRKQLIKLADELFETNNPGRYVQDQRQKILKASHILFSVADNDANVFVPRPDPNTNGYLYFEKPNRNRTSIENYSDEHKIEEAIETIHDFLHIQRHSDATLKKAFPLKKYPRADARTTYDIAAIAIAETDYYAVLDMATAIVGRYSL
jgi:hypothetical protein